MVRAARDAAISRQPSAISGLQVAGPILGITEALGRETSGIAGAISDQPSAVSHLLDRPGLRPGLAVARG